MRGIQQKFDFFCYAIDHTEVVMVLVQKLTQGMPGRIILDKGNFYVPSATRQAKRVNELYKAGCQFKMLRPAGMGWPNMHAKTLLCDDMLAITGSCNLTHNGMVSSKEHVYVVSYPKVVGELVADFESTWELAETVGSKEIDEMMRKDAERNDKKVKDNEIKIKAAEAEAAAGNSSRRETERSLAAELLEVAGQK